MRESKRLVDMHFYIFNLVITQCKLYLSEQDNKTVNGREMHSIQNITFSSPHRLAWWKICLLLLNVIARDL